MSCLRCFAYMIGIFGVVAAEKIVGDVIAHHRLTLSGG